MKDRGQRKAQKRMSKRAADSLRKHRRILQDVLRRLREHDLDDAEYLLEQEIESMAIDAKEEREAGKRWWREEQSKVQHRPRVDGEIQIPPKVEPWW